jgi:hypothetical protein
MPAIQESDIVFVKSQVMDDVPEGGGAATGVIVPDGVMNNVFEDISDLDRAYGRFNLRKIFLAVRALNTDLYGGAKTVITRLPEDPAIGYTLFTTNDAFDTRAAAADAVEAYLYKGPLWAGALNENHIAGMRVISVIQRTGSVLPPIGKTLCLVEDEGLSGEKEQYVRVIDVDAVATTFTDDKGDFVAWIVSMTLSDALRFDFDGHTVNRYFTYSYTGKTRIRDTSVADATRYYGSQPLALAAEIGDLTVKATTIYNQLVPSAQTETPLVDQYMNGQVAPLIASRSSTLSYTVAGAVIAANGRFALDTGALPGTISVTVGSVVITDDGAGNAIRSGAIVGAWDYVTGQCAFNSSAPSASGTATVVYQPATAAAQQAHTRALEVTAENRRLNWIETLSPIPAPSSLTVAFRVLGNWYVLADNNGILSGSDAGFGAGTLSFVTGIAAVTLGALPDVGSQILWTWGSPVHYTVRAGDTAIQIPSFEAGLGYACRPGSVTLTWLQSTVEKTATVATNGAISGNGATGHFSHSTGLFWVRWATLPDANSQLEVEFDTGAASPTTEALVPALDDGEATITLTGAPVLEGSVTLVWSVERLKTTWSAETLTRRATDDGLGALFLDGVEVGTINYTTGACVFTALQDYDYNAWTIVTGGGSWETDSATETLESNITATYFPDSASFDADSVSLDLPEVRLDLTPLTADPVVPGSLRFAWAGSVYVDRSGLLYRAISPTTGSGTVAGSIDYATGQVVITHWTAGANTLTVNALLTRYGDWTAIEASFRTTLSPIKPEALSILATLADGTAITGSANAGGVIAGDWMRGEVNYEFGTAWIEFGQLAGAVWTPAEVDPGTIRYNAVAYTYVPLDATILGIDAVRLPTDGRVPIFRAGDVVMVIHTDTTAPAVPAYHAGSNTYRISCGRTRIAWVRVVDGAGETVIEGFTLDRENGIVSWVSLSGLVTPVTVQHTVGDLRLVTDAQINGVLTLARPLTHDYPADDSLVCACLIHGDRRARVSAVWDQSSWNSTWVDVLVGSAATATLNTIDFPITVTNEGCDTDRWLLRWLTTTSVELISEKRGLIWTGSYTSGGSDIAPINPRTRTAVPGGGWAGGVPYMVIPAAANGGGWSAGNVVRINTIGAIADLWMARAIQQSDEPLDDGADGCEVYALGNIDRP